MYFISVAFFPENDYSNTILLFETTFLLCLKNFFKKRLDFDHLNIIIL